MKVPAEHWDTILIYLSVKKLDAETKKQWSLAQADALPTKNEFVDFLVARARALADSTKPNTTASAEKRKTTSSHHSSKARSAPPSCPKCPGSHYLNKCPAFISRSIADRQSLITDYRRCSSCLGTHTTAYCKMKWTCLICGERHHYLLHKEGTQQNSKYNPAFSSAASTLHKTVYSAHSKANAETSSVILLGTLEVGASHPG